MMWFILTGEYPPQRGGVSDYTYLVANELLRCGDEVEVWCPPTKELVVKSGPRITRLRDHFDPISCLALSRRIQLLPKDARILVQYVPQAFGLRGLNLFFGIWLWRQRNQQAIDLMFHEVATPWGHGLGMRALRQHCLALVTRIMAAFVAHSAENIYVSIPFWEELLRKCAFGRRLASANWLPVPSTIPEIVDTNKVTTVREELRGRLNATELVGHFGTFGGHIADGVRIALPELLGRRSVGVVLVGRGSEEFSNKLVATTPAFRGRIFAAGALTATEVAEYLAACDCLFQPYADGVSARRTSAMAGLALGKAIVTTFGFLSEDIWRESNAVRLVGSSAEIASAVIELLENEFERERLGHAAKALYDQRFALRHTIKTLRSRALVDGRVCA